MIIDSCLFPTQVRAGEREMMVCPPETFPNVVDCGLAAQGLVICRAMPTWTIGTLMPKEPGWLLYRSGPFLPRRAGTPTSDAGPWLST